MWETSSVLLIAGDEAVAVDPGISQEEIERVGEAAAHAGARVVAVLATHADWDHVAGIGSFPGAEAAMGPRAAAKVERGEALADMRGEGAQFGLSWPEAPRCDRVLRPGRSERVGPFAVETMELAGHTDCGLGYRLRDPDVLLVGDHLSPIEYPFVYHSTSAYRSTLAGLIDLLEDDPPALVIPGHGGPLAAADARAIAISDLEYLRALRRAVAGSLAGGAGRDGALEAALAVPPPRSLPIDAPEARRNAERQYEELVAC
jgi:glyoxylase-like metal-dependent hydrolase (beta-lactamase superfamily II)